MTPWKAALSPWDTAAEQMKALKRGCRKKHIRKRYFMPLGAVLQRSDLVSKTCLRHSYPSHWPMVSGTAAHSPCSLSSKKSKKAQLPSAASNVKKASKRRLAQPWFCSVMCCCPLDFFVPKWPFFLPLCHPSCLFLPSKVPLICYLHIPAHSSFFSTYCISLPCSDATKEGRSIKFKGS